MKHLLTRFYSLTVVGLASAVCSQASTGSLPWSKPLQLIAADLQGPVAYAIGIIGIVVAGGGLLFGGDLSEFGRKGAMLGLIISLLLFAGPFLSTAFGISGALIK